MRIKTSITVSGLLLIGSNVYSLVPEKGIPSGLRLGEVAYVALQDIIPGQMRYSQKNIDLKVNSARKGQGFTQKGNVIILQHDNGKSAFPEKFAAPVMKIRDRLGRIKYVL